MHTDIEIKVNKKMKPLKFFLGGVAGEKSLVA